jgi:hypothetical protein
LTKHFGKETIATCYLMSGATQDVWDLHKAEDERSYQSNRSLESDLTTPLATEKRKLRAQLGQVEQSLQLLPYTAAVERKKLQEDKARLSSMMGNITSRTGRGKLTTGKMLRTPIIGRSIRVALQASSNDVPTHFSSRDECVECKWRWQGGLALCTNCSASLCTWHRELIQKTGKRKSCNLGSSSCVCANRMACMARCQAVQNALSDLRGAD